MNNTQLFNPVVKLSFAIGVALLLILGFAIWFSLTQPEIGFSRLALSEASSPEQLVVQPSEVNNEGLAIYHQSERNLGSPKSNAEGMKIYHMSERVTIAGTQSNAAGLEIYWQSERGKAESVSIEEGLAIYLESEHNYALANPTTSKEEGIAIYYASERDR